MKYIYLAGPVSGRPYGEYVQHFDHVADEIRRRTMDLDITPFNPVRYCSTRVEKGAPWHDFMRVCISHLIECDGVGLLQGWERSRGARLELELAGKLKIPVVYIEPPVDSLHIFTIQGQNNSNSSDILSYHEKCVERFEREGSDNDLANSRAIIETANRYLDPHGFEYIERETV
jgi:hypothetical protein